MKDTADARDRKPPTATAKDLPKRSGPRRTKWGVVARASAIVLAATWIGAGGCVRSAPKDAAGATPGRPSAAGGYCEAMAQRSLRCPQEGIDLQECPRWARCYGRVMKPAALALVTDCLGRTFCNPHRAGWGTCVDQARYRQSRSPMVQAVERACSERGISCGGIVPMNCFLAPTLKDEVLQGYLDCLHRDACGQIQTCLQGLLTASGCGET